jgi:dihydrofolate synthase/folylpolyglutamate synthase
LGAPPIRGIPSPTGEFLLDGAHNPDGMAALVAALEGQRIGGVIFGALADNSWRPMLERLGAIDAPRFYVSPAGRAPAKADELLAVLPGVPHESLASAIEEARIMAGDLPIVICGSLYLVGEARALLLGLPRDPIVAL